jgi:Streptomycin 6-kinase
MDLDHLAWLRHEPGGHEWLDSLPELIRTLASDWSLTLGDPYSAAHVSFAVPVHRGDGSDAVLKVQFPHRECEHEAEALRRWSGDGAVQLLDHDADRHALLIERCDPGTHLANLGGVAALDVLVELVPQLWVPAAEPFATLADEAVMWIEHLGDPRRSGGVAADVAEVAIGLLRELGPSQPESVLLHQDLHGDNVLAASREAWLVIDPKPLVGERALAAAPIVRSVELGDTRADVMYRLDRLSAELELDRERARGWTIAQTVAWRSDSMQPEWGDQFVRWLLDA